MHILVLDDDRAFRGVVASALREEGFEVMEAGAPSEALRRVSEVELLLTDLQLPEMDGLEVLRRAKEAVPSIEAIVMTAHGTIPTAVEAMRRGAHVYLTKPFEPEELLLHIREIRKLHSYRQNAGGRGGLVGASAAMRRVYEAIDLAASTESNVLVLGETGTGKELAARAIHDLSVRSSRPFVPVQIGGLPRDLVESELFGAETGAFTGAKKREGRFAACSDGTLFLDEIDSSSVETQAKLLRAIESREFWPLGASRATVFRGRVVAAAQEGIERKVTKGEFREDLFYRLNVLRIEIPPLRERPEDIPAIASALLAGFLPDAESTGFSAEALGGMMLREWRGNVRELRNVIERAAARHSGAGAKGSITIGIDDLGSAEPGGAPKLPFKEAKARAAEEWSKRTIGSALAASDGNVSRAARSLQMSRTALISLINRFGLRAKPD